jgi:hypothetical protein
MAGAASDVSGENRCVTACYQRNRNASVIPLTWQSVAAGRRSRIDAGGGYCPAASLADYVYWQTFTGLLPR